MDSEKIEKTDYFEKKYNRSGRALGGLVVVAVGVILLLKQMSLVIFPYWLFTWPMFLIVLGLYIGLRHRFRSWGGWLILMFIGGVFLVRDYFPEYAISDYIWPIAIIVIGLYMILRPRHKYNSSRFRAHWNNYDDKWKNSGKEWSQHKDPVSGQPLGETSGDDYLDETSIFGGVNRVVVSKNFKGGDVVNIFGGCDINLTQADFNGTVTIDFVQIFGGAKIVVPTDWRVIIKTTSVFGGVEDKRPPSLIKENPDKTLIIEGTSIFAGISVQCY